MIDNKPLISIIIPVYNAENTIINTLESVKLQTFKDYEVILIDDGSSDNSVLKIKSFINDNPEIIIKLILKENGGVSSARNVGLKISTAYWIALLDSDDVWLPNKLDLQIKIVSNDPKIDFLGTNRNGEYRKIFYCKKFHYLTNISSHILLYKNFFVTPSVIFKRSILNQVGMFDDKMRYGEDVNFYIRVSEIFNCVLLNESLVITGAGKPHFGHSGLSSNLNRMSKGEIDNIIMAYKMGIVSKFEFYFLIFYSILKYFRRILLVKLRLNRFAK